MSREADATLERLRARLASGRPARKALPPWEPPQASDFRKGLPVLAFDGSLSDFGWVAVEVSHAGVTVGERGSIRPLLAGETGYWSVWRKSLLLSQELHRLRWKYSLTETIACEAPWIENNPGMRTESTLIAGTIAYTVFYQSAFIPVAAQHASSVLCGNRKHDKAEVRDAVARYVPEAGTRRWNEGQRDALAVGLTCLWDLAREPSGK